MHTRAEDTQSSLTSISLLQGGYVLEQIFKPSKDQGLKSVSFGWWWCTF